MENKHEDNSIAIALLKRDIENFNSLFSKLDDNLEKMSEVSNSVSRLLSIHDQKLDLLSETDRVLENKLEKNIHSFMNEIKDLHSHINSTNKNLMDNLKLTEGSLKSDIKSIKDDITLDRASINQSITEANKRIDAIERWKYVIIGGSAIVGYLLNKIPFSVIFGAS